MVGQTASVVNLEEFRRKRQSSAASNALPSSAWMPAMCCWVWVMVYPA